MLKTMEGIYRDGKVEFTEKPPKVREARVIVTFLPLRSSKVEAPKLTFSEVSELRGKLSAWEEDWNAPGMEAYDEM